MGKRVKLGMTASSIVSLVFSILGFVYLLLGICIYHFPTDEEDLIAGSVFAILGSAFLLVALILLICALVNRRQIQRILEDGHFIWGEIADVIPNYSVRINGRYGYTIAVRYADSNGCIHIFRSPIQKTYPDRSIIGKQVKVYYENESFRRYYVDLDGVLPRVVEH